MKITKESMKKYLFGILPGESIIGYVIINFRKYNDEPSEKLIKDIMKKLVEWEWSDEEGILTNKGYEERR